MNNLSIEELYKKNAYSIEKNGYGNSIFIIKDIFPGKISKQNKELFITHIISVIEESLEISRKNNETTVYVHIYLNSCTFKNFSLSFTKKMICTLSNRFEDTLEMMYIYSESVLFSNIWNLAKHFIEDDTRSKIKQIKN
jgi:hypothetical protein